MSRSDQLPKECVSDNEAVENADESEEARVEISKYSKCCLHNESDRFGTCGPFKRDKIQKDGLVEIQNLSSDTETHFKNLKFKDLVQNLKWSERKLIENRVARHLGDSEMICEKHRNTQGINWKQKQSCGCLHTELQRGMKGPATKLASMSLVKKINEGKPFSFVLGARICRKHQKQLEISDQEPIVPDCIVEQSVEYIPEKVFVPEEVRASSSHTASQLTELLNVSPIPHQITRTPVSRLSSSMKSGLKRKLVQVGAESIKCFAESVAPGQGMDLLNDLLNSESADEEDDDIPPDIMPLLEAYDKSDSQGKLIILSLVNRCHSKTTVQRCFGCTKYAVDTARKMKAPETGVTIPKKENFKRNRMNNAKCEDFLGFLFSSGILQDVAYGVLRLEFDDGSTQTVPNAILTTKYSHAISLYKEICSEANYIPLSDSTLFRILRALKLSQRKSLSGLDDITADGMNGFSYLENYLSSLKIYKYLIDRLENAKRYLKMRYQTHCSMDSPIATHNSVHALSTPLEVPSIPITQEVCADCHNLVCVLSEIEGIAMETGTDEIQYDVKKSIVAIFNYMKHQIRDSQQRCAKSFCFENLDSTTAFWLKDFAQKILPQRYREGQKEYFGKKGMSLHIDVFFRKTDAELLKYVYFTCIFRCTQSMTDVLNIGESVIKQFVHDCPMIMKLFAKSDNAGCYRGNFILEATYNLCKNYGLQLLRYDYNEPCRGKDQCDRESAGAKTVMNSFVHAGNNIKDATDVYNALHYGNGIKNSEVSVLEIDTNKTHLKGTEIPNISAFHSVEFFEDHMKLYRYFNVGPGKTIQYSKNNKFTSSFVHVKEFSSTQNNIETTKTKKAKKRKDHQLCRLLFCPEPSCSQVFESQEEFDMHLLAEEHVASRIISSMDIVRSSFVEKIKATSQLHTGTTSLETSTLKRVTLIEALEKNPLMKLITEQGWALPRRLTFRYSYIQKKMLYDIFMEGENTGKKKSPDEVERILRSKLQPVDYVSASQIRSLFSRFATKLKEGTLEEPVEDNNDQTAVVDEIEVIEGTASNNEDDEYQDDLEREVLDVMASLADWEVDEYVAVAYDNLWYPGKVTGLLDDGRIKVSCMKYKNELLSTNKFLWPTVKDENPYFRDQLLLKIDEPIEINSGKRSSYYKVTDTDFACASDMLKIFLARK